MSIIYSVYQMHMSRSAASSTASDITGYLGFSSGGESSSESASAHGERAENRSVSINISGSFFIFFISISAIICYHCAGVRLCIHRRLYSPFQ